MADILQFPASSAEKLRQVQSLFALHYPGKRMPEKDSPAWHDFFPIFAAAARKVATCGVFPLSPLAERDAAGRDVLLHSVMVEDDRRSLMVLVCWPQAEQFLFFHRGDADWPAWLDDSQLMAMHADMMQVCA